MKKLFFINFAKLTGKYLCCSLFLNKVAGLRPVTLLKKRLRHRCFPVNFPKKFLEHLFSWNTSGGYFLLLYNKVVAEFPTRQLKKLPKEWKKLDGCLSCVVLPENYGRGYNNCRDNGRGLRKNFLWRRHVF